MNNGDLLRQLKRFYFSANYKKNRLEKAQGEQSQKSAIKLKIVLCYKKVRLEFNFLPN